MTRFQWTFLALIASQAAHAVEEYLGRLWEVFAPARALTGLLSTNREAAFIAVNGAFVAFGLWCFLWPVRRRWPSGTALVWVWVVVELANGIVHPAWAFFGRGYRPGVVTASLLLLLAIYLARQLTAGAASRPVGVS